MGSGTGRWKGRGRGVGGFWQVDEWEKERERIGLRPFGRSSTKGGSSKMAGAYCEKCTKLEERGEGAEAKQTRRRQTLRGESLKLGAGGRAGSGCVGGNSGGVGGGSGEAGVDGRCGMGRVV